jgi:hypothetical protein
VLELEVAEFDLLEVLFVAGEHGLQLGFLARTLLGF